MSKHDATKTQKLGTIMFKNKKLNIGPAIRQKGVVYSNEEEEANEPIYNTGVCIHSDGQCFMSSDCQTHHREMEKYDPKPSDCQMDSGIAHSPVCNMMNQPMHHPQMVSHPRPAQLISPPLCMPTAPRVIHYGPQPWPQNPHITHCHPSNVQVFWSTARNIDLEGNKYIYAIPNQSQTFSK